MRRRYDVQLALGVLIRKGAKFVAEAPIPATAMTHWSAAFTGGKVSVPAGTVLVVHHDQVPGAVGVSCLPANYDELHSVFIPAEDREADKYGGYSLSILVSELVAHAKQA